jgi:hypothetical protein
MPSNKIQTSNPKQRASVNVAQGPRSGNTGSPDKRAEFKSAKSTSSSERSKLADFVMSALGMRGKGMQPYVNPALENLNSNSAKTTGISKNSTADGSRLPGKYKSPKTKG